MLRLVTQSAVFVCVHNLTHSFTPIRIPSLFSSMARVSIPIHTISTILFIESYHERIAARYGILHTAHAAVRRLISF